MYIWSICVL